MKTLRGLKGKRLDSTKSCTAGKSQNLFAEFENSTPILVK